MGHESHPVQSIYKEHDNAVRFTNSNDAWPNMTESSSSGEIQRDLPSVNKENYIFLLAETIILTLEVEPAKNTLLFTYILKHAAISAIFISLYYLFKIDKTKNTAV